MCDTLTLCILQEAVVASETKRRYERLAPHFYNDVWNHRKNPPEDWNKPLPAQMQEEYKNTYLDHKAREYKAAQTWCTARIMHLWYFSLLQL